MGRSEMESASHNLSHFDLESTSSKRASILQVDQKHKAQVDSVCCVVLCCVWEIYATHISV